MEGRMAGFNRAIRSKLPSEAHDWLPRPLVAAALGAAAPWMSSCQPVGLAYLTLTEVSPCSWFMLPGSMWESSTFKVSVSPGTCPHQQPSPLFLGLLKTNAYASQKWISCELANLGFASLSSRASQVSRATFLAPQFQPYRLM